MNNPFLLKSPLSLAALTAAAALTLPLVGCQNREVGPDADDGGPTLESDNMRDGDRDGRTADRNNRSNRGAGNSQFTEDGQGATGVSRASAASGDAEIQVDKSVPEEIVLGKTLTYNVKVSNAGDGAVTGLRVMEELPEGFDFISSEPAAELGEDGRTLTFEYGDLAAGGSKTIQITGTPQRAGSLQACTSYDFSRGVCAVMNVVNPNLRLVKTGPSEVGLCAPAQYVYEISNPGSDASEDVVVVDELPEGLVLAEGGGRRVNLDVGTVNPGQTVRKGVAVTAQREGTYGSFASAKSELLEVNSQRVQTTFVAPELDVSVRSPRDVEYIGRTARFNVDVRNTGEVATRDTSLRLSLEGSGKIARVTGPGLQPGTANEGGRLAIGSLEPGQSRNLVVEVLGDEEGQATLAAVAEATCDDNDRVLAQAQANDLVRFQTLSALQVEVVDKADPVQVGENTVYEITIINEGTGPDQNLRVTAELPDGLSFVGGEGSTAVQASGKQLTMAPVPTLEAGDSVTWYVTAKADSAAGATKFKVTAQSANIPDPVEEEEPTRLY